MASIQEFYSYIRKSLKNSGIDQPGLEARILMRELLGLEDSDLIGGTSSLLTDEQQRKIESALERRLAGEPVSRITSCREFWGLQFKVTPDVLDPRPDTETLVAASLQAFRTQKTPARILDLGTGSGCILVSLLHEWQQAEGIGVDISPAALAVAEDNAHMNGVGNRARFLKSRWGEEVSGQFDLIVSNPPYIDSADIANLQVEVRNYDPILALDGGNDGLDAYRTLFSQIKRICHENTKGFFEVGVSQGQDVVRLAEESGFRVESVHRDLAGIPRVVEISLGEK